MKLILVVFVLFLAAIINGMPIEEAKSDALLTKSNWCCAIDPPAKPVFSHNGDLLYYEPQPCPNQYLVCCKGHLNVNGNCLDFDEINELLPTWQALASALGISVQQAMLLIG